MNRTDVNLALERKALGAFTKFNSFDGRISISYNLEASKAKGKDLWSVDSPFYFYIGKKEDAKWVMVPKNFLTNGANVPRPLWSLIPPWGVYGNAVIVHDYLCEHKFIMVNNVAVKVTNKEIDDIFLEAMSVSGVGALRYVIWAGVRVADLIGMR